jgi:hypothetical protein
MANQKLRSLTEITYTPANYARIEGFARAVIALGGTVPPEMLSWARNAEAQYSAMTPAQQQATLHELGHYREQVTQYQETTDSAAAYAEAGQYFRDNSRGIGGNEKGVDAKTLREIAENRVTVTDKRVPRKDANGATVSLYGKTQYDTDRKESRKYSDSDSRRASLVLSFAKYDGQRASNGADMLAKSDAIPDYKLNDNVHAGGDVARAMEQLESAAAAGHDMPTADYSPSNFDPPSEPEPK